MAQRDRESYPGKTPDGGSAGTTETTMPQGSVKEIDPAPGGTRTFPISGPGPSKDMV